MTTALIAEDEPLLAQALQMELLALWPELRIVAQVGDGASAVQAALQHCPDVLFLDIRMPGQDGLEAAMAIAEGWPPQLPLPRIVFVTAFDAYAVQAFDAQAIDYVLKPVRRERLVRTVQRLQASLQSTAHSHDTLLAPLRALLQRTNRETPPLRLLQAGTGHSLHMVPVEDVLLLEACDKHVRVLTLAQQEHWLRTPLKDLLQGLDTEQFWQIHRGLVVRAEAISTARRDINGQWRVWLHGQTDAYKVSRLFAHRFRAM